MDEQAIAAKLAENIPRDEPVAPQTATIASDTPTDTGYVDDMPFDELTKYKLSELFLIPQHLQSNPETNKKLGLVYGWAATVSGSNDYLEIAGFLTRMEGMLGQGGLQSRLDKFYHYATLDLQRRKIEQEMTYVGA